MRNELSSSSNAALTNILCFCPAKLKGCFGPLCCIFRKGTNAWRFLANLTSPVSDGCLAAVEGRLWLVGGEQGVGVAV